MKHHRLLKKHNTILVPTAIISAVLTLFFFILIPAPVYANSAQKYFEGVSATGAIMRGDSPIVVEKETLTFDIDEFPQSYYDLEEKFLTYDGKVTAEYTFYNPSEFTVTSTLCFPFGKTPSYAPDYPFFDDDPTHYEDQYSRVYCVTVNGMKIAANLRHTFSAPFSTFDVERDLNKLADGYIEDDFYTPDLPVVKYTYTVEEFQNTKNDFNAYVAFEIAKIDDDARVYFPEMLSVYQTDGVYRVGTCVDTNKTFDIYVFGGDESLKILPNWKFYSNGGLNDGDEITGKMSAPKAKSMTFEEFALEGRGEYSQVSEIDWYNAVLTQLSDKRSESNCPAVTLAGYADTLEKNLMHWYEYELTFAPGERVINSVTAPIYPAVIDNFDPPKYCYTYLLSPAKTWSEFGKLDIKINTPYFMSDNSAFPSGFEKTDDGFKLTLDGLPSGELTFTLCASENPKEENGGILWVFIAMILGVLTLFGTAIPFTGIAGNVIIALLLLRPMLDIVGGIVTTIALMIVKAVKKRRKADRVLNDIAKDTPDTVHDICKPTAVNGVGTTDADDTEISDRCTSEPSSDDNK